MFEYRLFFQRGLIAIVLIGFCSGCLGQIPFTSEQLERFAARPENLRLEFFTGKGRQVAFYLPPLQTPDEPPRRLSILYSGIKSVSLGWLQLIDPAAYPDMAYLLIDYPGRGDSEGLLDPEALYLNSEGALTALADHFGQKDLHPELNLLGHSFGSGAALQFALRHPVDKVVLVAPYNTLKQAVAELSTLLAILLPTEIDNRAQIRELLTTDPPPAISIFHGAKDEVLPVQMGRELAAIAPDAISYYEFPEENHTSILLAHRALIFQQLDRRKETGAGSVVKTVAPK